MIRSLRDGSYLCCLERCRERHLAVGLAIDLEQRLDSGCTEDGTIGLVTGVGLKGKVMVEVERGKDFGTESFRILGPLQDEDTYEGGNDRGRSTAEIEEMELRFTLPPPKNPGHYYH